MEQRRCRECGCTEGMACVLVGAGGEVIRTCRWVDVDLCSACAVGASSFLYPGQQWLHPEQQRRAA